MGSRFITFLIIVLAIWTVMHVYVLWRVWTISWVSLHVPRKAFIIAAASLWLCYPLARVLASHNLDAVAFPLEWVGAAWMGALFILFSFVLVVDVVTVGGWLSPKFAMTLRGAVVCLALVLSIAALVQGARAPVLQEYEVTLRGLPRERDGMFLVMLSDLHLGTLLGRAWMQRLAERVNGLQPDLIVVVGDIIDGNAARVEPLAPVLANLQAPLGVWAVTGNHEYYAGIDASVDVLKQAGFRLLRDRNEAIGGLVLAGVDDLTARGFHDANPSPITAALSSRATGPTILLCHTPWGAESAERLGAGLMLCGHTHNGQVWPFNYFVRLRYKLLGGRYQVGEMPVIVSRGAGMWGPPMRLWYPSEIVRIRLRST